MKKDSFKPFLIILGMVVGLMLFCRYCLPYAGKALAQDRMSSRAYSRASIAAQPSMKYLFRQPDYGEAPAISLDQPEPVSPVAYDSRIYLDPRTTPTSMNFKRGDVVYCGSDIFTGPFWIVSGIDRGERYQTADKCFTIGFGEYHKPNPPPQPVPAPPVVAPPPPVVRHGNWTLQFTFFRQDVEFLDRVTPNLVYNNQDHLGTPVDVIVGSNTFKYQWSVPSTPDGGFSSVEARAKGTVSEWRTAGMLEIVSFP